MQANPYCTKSLRCSIHTHPLQNHLTYMNAHVGMQLTSCNKECSVLI